MEKEAPLVFKQHHHVLISGTGRAGTSLLVELLTHAGVDTGYLPENVKQLKHELANAGLEHTALRPGSPYVAKSPHFCSLICRILERSDVVIDHVIVPIRSVSDAAASRRRVQSAAEMLGLLQGGRVPGGLWDTGDEHSQEAVLAQHLANLLYRLTEHEIPITLMAFPRLVTDRDYCVHKLRRVFPAIEHSRLEAAFEACVDPSLVHAFGTQRPN